MKKMTLYTDRTNKFVSLMEKVHLRSIASHKCGGIGKVNFSWLISIKTTSWGNQWFDLLTISSKPSNENCTNKKCKLSLPNCKQ